MKSTIVRSSVWALMFIFLINFQLKAQDQLKPKLRKGSIASVSAAIPEIKTGIVKVIAIRVEFVEDSSSLTTGNGKFDYSDTSAAEIDPAPHDRQYFLDQLEAMKRYYERVSNGNLNIDYTLFPSGDRTAYQLPNMMEYYNPNTTEEELDVRLSELLQDAVELADADPEVSFTDYDAVIVYHAGVGSDFLLEEVALDPTPHDIPSVHLDLKHLQNTLGVTDGISVAGGAKYITSGTILPETESKRDVEIGMLGISVHQFGHELGLPSLFNTDNGRSAIGMFGLMGVGFANVDGRVPAEPSAWSKVYMGWESPLVIEHGDNLQVAASKSPTGTKIYKVPVTNHEYFLIENRNTDYEGDGLIAIQGASGVLLEYDDYDAGIPGSGLLIWHIDETVIAEGLADNSVNADPVRRGVDLEEADGSQDMGELFLNVIPGVLTPENGIPWDTFHQGNNTEFTPTSVPNSKSNSGGESHVYITDISDSGKVMMFSIERKHTVPTFPKYLGGQFNKMPPVWAGPDAEGGVKLFAANRFGRIFALDGVNHRYMPNSFRSAYQNAFGTASILPVPVFAETGSPMSFPPSVMNSSIAFDQHKDRMYVVTDDADLVVYSLTNSEEDGLGDVISRTDLPSSPTTPVILGNRAIIGMLNGQVAFHDEDGIFDFALQPLSEEVRGISGIFNSFVTEMISASYGGTNTLYGTTTGGWLDQLGSVTIESPYAPVITDLDGENGVELITLNRSGQIVVLGDDFMTMSRPRDETDIVSVTHPYQFHFDPVIGDIDGDGTREIITASGSNIFAFNRGGYLKDGFPVDIYYLGYTDSVSSHLVLGDIDGDDRQDILFGTDKGNIFAINSDGLVLPKFPLPISSASVSSPTILRNSDADRMELAVIDDDGWLYLWDLETTYDDKIIAWGSMHGNSANWRTNLEELKVTVPPIDNSSIMPKDRVYNWPNPNTGNWTNIRYYLTNQADVTVKIYSQAGDLIATLNGPGIPMIDNEITWQLDNVQSGVYFAQVTARSGAKTEKKVIKIAVIK